MKCAEESWTFHTSTEAMRFLSWSRADLLASAYDCIPYQHCHQNLKAWSSENRPFLRESELEYKFHPFFPVSSLRECHRCRSLCFRKILSFWISVLSHCPNGFCTEQLVGQILASSHQVMLGRSSKHKRHPRQGNTSITEQHLAEMIRDQDICGEW